MPPWVTSASVVIAILLFWPPSAALAQHPQAIVTSFCRADAFGARTSPASLGAVAELVAWNHEPAWDEVVLITGFEVGAAEAVAGDRVEVEVAYTVVARLGPNRREVAPEIVRRRFQLGADDDGWWILGPPPPPHVFVQHVDQDATRRGLAGAGGYVSHARFVAEVMRIAGWPVAVETLDEIVLGRTYGPVEVGRAGDLAVFFDGEHPYHVGLLEEPGVLVSATLSDGLVRTPPSAFAGAVRYLRLRQPLATGPLWQRQQTGSEGGE